MASVKIDDSKVRDTWVKYRRTRRKIYKNKLIETYLPLVRQVAERMHMTLPASVELGDLISMGTFAGCKRNAKAAAARTDNTPPATQVRRIQPRVGKTVPIVKYCGP